MVTIKKFDGYQHLAEIFQDLDLKFSFVKNNKQVTMPAKCRDFLGDCLWSRATKKKVSIYSFEYDYKETPYEVKEVQLTIKFPDENKRINFINNLAFIHEKEKQAGIKKLTKIEETQEKDTLFITASKLWQGLPWTLALYTYYLKVMSLKDPNHVTIYPETGYKNWIDPMESTILSWVKKKIAYSWHDDIYDQHNYSGVISMLKKSNNLIELYQ